MIISTGTLLIWTDTLVLLKCETCGSLCTNIHHHCCLSSRLVLLKHDHRMVDGAEVVEVGTDFADVVVDNADIMALLLALIDTS